MTGDPTGGAFASELGRLKRRGSAVLVHSPGDGSGVCRDLLGSPLERRRRVLVRAAEFAPLPILREDTVVVDATAADARSAASVDPGPVERRTVDGADVDAVAAAVIEALARVSGDDPVVGEVRVCLGRLEPFIERTGVERVGKALETVATAVRERRGMAHAHVSADVGAEAMGVLEAVVDVTVEARETSAGIRQQRWHLHGAGIDTGWLRTGRAF